MRGSGETKAPEGADAEGPRDESTGADGRSTQSPSRPYPIWLKVEPPRRRFASPPDGLSRLTWTRLSRQIAAFLRSRLHNTVTLRLAVRRVAAEMSLTGATVEEIAVVLRRAVLEHPDLSTLDRTNIVTRRLASEELLDRMLEWARELGSSDMAGED